MSRRWLLCLCSLMMLTGCAGVDMAHGTTNPYWTEECEGCQVILRDSAATQGDLEVVLLSDGQETVLKTLTGAKSENVFAEHFSNVMGWNGFRLTERQGQAVGNREDDWSIRPYYMVESGGARKIAESFGWGAPQDYSVDLEGDGVKELVSNVVYGGDGHQNAYVYQRRGDEVWLGTINTEGLPGHDNWGVNSTAVIYDPARNVFQIKYSVKNQEEPGLLETSGLERLEFYPFDKP